MTSFNVGDKIVKINGMKDVLTIESLENRNTGDCETWAQYNSANGHGSIKLSAVNHATPEEIEAGYRLND